MSETLAEMAARLLEEVNLRRSLLDHESVWLERYTNARFPKRAPKAARP